LSRKQYGSILNVLNAAKERRALENIDRWHRLVISKKVKTYA
jgi:hypothetical protein